MDPQCIAECAQKWVLRAVNDLKSEVSCFSRLLIEHGIMHEDPPCRSKQQGAAGKENVMDPKPKNQRSERFAGTAAKGQGKNNKSGLASSYLSVGQELLSDSESEGGYACIAMVQQRPPLQLDYRALNVHCRKDWWMDYWSKAQLVNGIEVRTSALASMCLADDDLAGSQLSPGTPTSHPQDQMMTNLLSLYASFLGFQAQPAESGYSEALI
jgi:hypothetical protein